jgi:cytochrome c oxidase assembly factor CtaG
VYLQGWLHVRRSLPSAARVWRPVAFLGGLLALWIAVGSPLWSLDEKMLVVHMAKHLLVMAVAAPLLLLGAPHLPLVYPFVHWPPVARVTRVLTHPVFCWLSATFAVMVWHVPDIFELGMRSHWWHLVEFASFFGGGLLFWWPVIQPWQRARWSRWSIPLYLFLATLPCDVLSAYLTFCDDVVYRPYLGASPASTVAALQDQQVAGALMWVSVTFVYLLPAVVITLQMLSPSGGRDPWVRLFRQGG